MADNIILRDNEGNELYPLTSAANVFDIEGNTLPENLSSLYPSFRGTWDNWSAVPSNSADYPEDYRGRTTPIEYDYMIVRDASTFNAVNIRTWMFKYRGKWETDGKNGWVPEYECAGGGDYLELSGGTMENNAVIKMGGNSNATGASLTWGKVGSNTPYIGFASDQVDGTFIITSLKGTKYTNGLSIGGGSGNLFWMGNKVVVDTDSRLSDARRNPQALTIVAGETTITYDGSTAQSVTVGTGSGTAVKVWNLLD